MSFLTTLTSYTHKSIPPCSPIEQVLPLDAFFRFGFPFLSSVTLAFLLTFLLSGEILLLLLPFIILGLMTPPELLRILLSMARLNHPQSEDGEGRGGGGGREREGGGD